jgi:hypothetical protein
VGNPYKQGLPDGSQQSVEFPNDDPAVVDCYVKSLQANKIKYEWPSNSADDCLCFTKLYVFCDKMKTKIFQDYVIDSLRYTIIKERMTIPLMEWIAKVYKSTSEDSYFRDMVVSMFMCFGSDADFAANKDTVPHDFSKDRNEKLLRVRDLRKLVSTQQKLKYGWPWSYFLTISGNR